MSISLTVKASWAAIGWGLHWHRIPLAGLRMNGHADNQWGQMRVSRVRYGTPHSWALIKSYELSLMGMCYVCWFPFISLYAFLCSWWIIFMDICINPQVWGFFLPVSESVCFKSSIAGGTKTSLNRIKHTRTHVAAS